MRIKYIYGAAQMYIDWLDILKFIYIFCETSINMYIIDSVNPVQWHLLPFYLPNEIELNKINNIRS